MLLTSLTTHRPSRASLTHWRQWLPYVARGVAELPPSSPLVFSTVIGRNQSLSEPQQEGPEELSFVIGRFNVIDLWLTVGSRIEIDRSWSRTDRLSCDGSAIVRTFIAKDQQCAEGDAVEAKCTEYISSSGKQTFFTWPSRDSCLLPFSHCLMKPSTE